MTNYVGLSAFGLNEAINGQSVFIDELRDRPSSVVLMDTSTLLSGEEALTSRISTGFHWPEESRVADELDGLTRFLVGVLWQRLLVAGTSVQRWGRFSTEDMLVKHAMRLANLDGREHLVLAIPNRLSTKRQEGLLRAFAGDRSRVHLLWRPVAATLGWLSKIEREVFTEDGWVGVIYLGLDGFEATVIDLNTSHPDVVIPVRSRPKRPQHVMLTGFDLAQSVLSHTSLPRGLGIRWQELFRLPNLWRSLQQEAPRASSHEECLYSDGHHWRYWPEVQWPLSYDDLAIEMKPLLLSELGGERQFGQTMGALSWGEYFERLTRSFDAQQGRCYGFIVTGPLAGRGSRNPAWVESFARHWHLPIRNTAAAKTVSFTTDDLISLGAKVYGDRLAYNEEHPEARLPTYYDTLPSIEIYVAKEQELVWKGLFEESVCEGGRSATNTMENTFSLPPKKTSTEIWLRMLDDAEDEESKTPYRLSEVFFERMPDEKVPLTLRAEMQPSSGYATVYFTPSDSRFKNLIRGKGAFLNFDEMTPKTQDDLPEMKLAYPLDRHIPILHRDQLEDAESFIKNLFSLANTGPVTEFRELIYSRHMVYENGRKAFLNIFNENGEQELFTQKELQRLMDILNYHKDHPTGWYAASSWMWKACPEPVRQAIFCKARSADVPNLNLLGYTFRICVQDIDIQNALALAYKACYNKWAIQGSTRTTLEREIARFLNFNPQAVRFLEKHVALKELIMKRIENRLLESTQTRMDYTYMLSLLALMLKIRKVNPDFLHSQKEQDDWIALLTLADEQVLQRYRGWTTKRKTDPTKALEKARKYNADIRNFIKEVGNNILIITEDNDFDEE